MRDPAQLRTLAAGLRYRRVLAARRAAILDSVREPGTLRVVLAARLRAL